METALVVEDSVTDREAITRYLHRGGFKVLTAESGEEALEKISQLRPDVIILDILLPGLNGFKICRDLKATPETSHIPIVLCSTKGTEMDKFWGLKQGADAYLPKPVDPEEIIRIIKDLLKS